MSDTSDDRPALGIGMIGYAFMGRAHSQAWHALNAYASDMAAAGAGPDLVYRIDPAAIAGRSEAKVSAAATAMGWRTYETDWRALIDRDDIGLIDVCTPGGNHAEAAIAALEAGKHVLCEKPLANTVDEARAMVEAARAAAGKGIRAMVGFNYRRVPAAALARRIVQGGRLGAIRHVRAVYAQDWLNNPAAPMAWRLKKELAGSGALGDIGSHIVDLTQFVTGQLVTGVSALTETFVKERPLADGSGTDTVTVDDAALFIGRLSGGAVASYEATRFATGRKNGLRFEVNGERGSVAFDLERLNELEVFLPDGPGSAGLGASEGSGADSNSGSGSGAESLAVEGFRRVLVTDPAHPYVAGWWPPGHIVGWQHTFTHEAYDLVTAITAGADPAPSFADGLQVQQVLEAVLTSAENGSSWVPVQSN